MISQLLGPLLGTVQSGVGAVANPTFSSWLGNYSSKKAQKRAYQYYLRSLRDSPLEQRKGLESAGYNPLLALGNIGSSSFSANSSPSFAPMGNLDLIGSAKEGSRLVNDITKGIKLENEKKELENANLKSDLDTKEVQRLQMEANRSLIESQDDRNSLAYGRDIVDTAVSIAGAAGSLYSAKAMADAARQNADVNARNQTLKEAGSERSKTVQRYDKHGKLISTDEISESANPMIRRGVPSVDSSAKGSRPSAAPHAGSSARSAGSAVKEIGRRILEDPMLLPVILGTAAIGEYSTPEGRKRQGDHYRRNWESNKYYSPLR